MDRRTDAVQAMGVAAEHRELMEKVIGCAFRDFNRMGYGFVESVYENCLAIELRRLGLRVESQRAITVRYECEVVGEFIADLFIEGVLLVELKSIRTLAPAHEVQLVNYLVATNTPIGLLINFGENGVEVKRKVRVLKSTLNPAHPVNPV